MQDRQEREYFDELKKILSLPLSDEDKKNRILQYHESDIADLLDELEPEERDELYRILGNDNIADVWSHAENIEELVGDMEPEKAADIIESMDADDAIDVLEELDEEQREEIVSLMEPEAKEDIKNITKYDDDMIGSRMTNNYISILNTNTVKEAMKRVVAEAADNDNVSNIYVVDEKDKLIGVIELRDLIIARSNTDLSTIIKLNYPYFRATELVVDCLPDMKEYSLDSYPILNNNDELVGVITSGDVTEAIDDELGEDYAKLAGLTNEEDPNEGVLHSVKKRLPWLIVLLVLGLVQSFSMTGFERVIAALPIIVFFQTLVLDMAGNVGTQSLAVTIRRISSLEDSKRRILKAVLKELRIGFVNGLILGTLSFAFVLLFLFITKQGVHSSAFSWVEALKGAGIVGIALLTAMSVSSFVGAVVPVIFLKIHIDPAVASGPFITTINDITALLIYYGLAMVLFQLI
ncbi:MAG: magnesium transporter [Acholeplasmatales bacterium]|nr:magnesium transporter [Acholeplasmatales bacterium]